MKTNLKITMVTLLVTLTAFSTPVFASTNNISYSNTTGNVSTNIDSNNTTTNNYNYTVNNVSITNNNYYNINSNAANNPQLVKLTDPNQPVGVFQIQDGTSIQNESSFFDEAYIVSKKDSVNYTLDSLMYKYQYIRTQQSFDPNTNTETRFYKNTVTNNVMMIRLKYTGNKILFLLPAINNRLMSMDDYKVSSFSFDIPSIDVLV